ncbi:MAG: class I SAM-dependent methyltransferase [Rhodovibrionaceae bacterium]
MIKNTPVLGSWAHRIYGKAKRLRFSGSSAYWEQRYRTGGNSGQGSYGRLAKFKAETLNSFVAEHGIETVVEFGCGDGAQLELANYPQYLGLDIAPKAVDLCRERFAQNPGMSFAVLGTIEPGKHELSMSLDVIYHLVEDEVFEAHMAAVFDASSKYIAIFSSNVNCSSPEPHVRHRAFSRWVESERPNWRLFREVSNAFPPGSDESETSFANFYFYVLDREVRQPELNHVRSTVTS